MKTAVCLLGVIIIIGSFFLFAQSQTWTERVENEDWRAWVLKTAHWDTYQSDPEAYIEFFGKAPEPPGAEPPKWVYVEHRVYTHTTLGAVVLLIGFVTLVIGVAIPKASPNRAHSSI